MGARTVRQLERNLGSLELSLEPLVCELLEDAGRDLKDKLGHSNVDPYESSDSTRIV